MTKFTVLGVSWFDLPLEVRRMWWRETDYSRSPSQEFTVLPEFLASEQAKRENDKRECAAAVAAACELLRQAEAQRPLCEQCLRPAPPCAIRCLRSLLHPDDPRSKGEKRT
jgi:hypothetical protein